MVEPAANERPNPGDTRRQQLERANAAGKVLAHQAGLTPGRLQRLFREGWTLPMVRQAAEIAVTERVRLRYIVRLHNHGVPMPVIPEILEIRSQYSYLSGFSIFRYWQLCMPPGEPTEDDREFFRTFLGAAEDLFALAEERLRSGVARSPSFIFGRLLEYIEAAGRDAERVYHELTDNPEALLDRILATSERSLDFGTQQRIRRENPWNTDEQPDLADLADDT